jgi:hypothetical protein
VAALQLIWLLHEPWPAQSTLQLVPAQVRPFGQLDTPLQCTSQLAAELQSTPVEQPDSAPHSMRQAAPAGHFTSVLHEPGVVQSITHTSP